jgi:hypothetical protein
MSFMSFKSALGPAWPRAKQQIENERLDGTLTHSILAPSDPFPLEFEMAIGETGAGKGTPGKAQNRLGRKERSEPNALYLSHSFSSTIDPKKVPIKWLLMIRF